MTGPAAFAVYLTDTCCVACGTGGDQEKFKEINEAYDVLRDPEKRKMYDQVRQRCIRPVAPARK